MSCNLFYLKENIFYLENKKLQDYKITTNHLLIYA